MSSNLLSGNEPLHYNHGPLPGSVKATVKDFWSWSGSDLLNNTWRGTLGEFWIACALNIVQEPREEWASWDLETKQGIRIEVKTVGLRQSWHCESDPISVPTWDIAPSYGWNSDSGAYSDNRQRWSDL